jgi:hypothetical protein
VAAQLLPATHTTPAEEAVEGEHLVKRSPPMEFQLWPALAAGVIGGALMAGTRMLMKNVAGVDLRMDMPAMLGTMVGGDGTPARMTGMAMHLVLSALIGAVYAWGFAALFNVRDNLWLWGLLGGAVHWAIAGLVIGMMPAMHPEVPGRLPAPGPFAKNLGMPDVPAFLMGHLLYGVAVGIVYALLHPAGGADVAF